MTHDKDKWALDLVNRLQETKIGDPMRLYYIKTNLEKGKPIYETDKQFLKEKSKQLQQLEDHKRKVEWALEFVEKLHNSSIGDPKVLEDFKNTLEKEKIYSKIDTQYIKEKSNQPQDATIHQKNTEWTLEFIKKLQEAKIGDAGRLEHIKNSLENEKTIHETDRQYLNEKSKQLQHITDNKNKAEFALDAIKKLHESEIKDYEILNKIKTTLQEGKTISDNEIDFLNTKYEKLQQEIDHQRKIEWTIDVTNKLLESEIGNPEKLRAIKNSLEEGKPVAEDDTSYLKEKYSQFVAIAKSKTGYDSDKKTEGSLQNLSLDSIIPEQNREN